MIIVQSAILTKDFIAKKAIQVRCLSKKILLKVLLQVHSPKLRKPAAYRTLVKLYYATVSNWSPNIDIVQQQVTHKAAAMQLL